MTLSIVLAYYSFDMLVKTEIPTDVHSLRCCVNVVKDVTIVEAAVGDINIGVFFFITNINVVPNYTLPTYTT